MHKQSIYFIINPISGGKNKDTIVPTIKKWLSPELFDYSYKFTEHHGHATILAAQAINIYDIIVAVGGDGTINEIAGVVANSNKVLAIIPVGSGNGLARFLDIPLKIKDAIQLINTKHAVSIDSGKLNGKSFFNMAGVGFDAHVSKVFSFDKKRGFLTYLRLGFKELFGYVPLNYALTIDGNDYTESAYAISIANSSQYGNDVHVAPNASITDGMLDVCIIKPFPLYKLPIFFFHILLKQAEGAGYVKIIKGMNIEIRQPEQAFVHIDGEPIQMDKDIIIQINPLSLKLITP